MRWIEFPDDRIVVEGLAWFSENKPELWRLPARLRETISPDLWQAGCLPSGGRLLLKSNTDHVVLRVKYPYTPEALHSPHPLNACPSAAVEIHLGGRVWDIVAPEKWGETELVLYKYSGARMNYFSIYLPLFAQIKIDAIGIDDEAHLSAWTPSYALEDPLVFYGSSITHGVSASRPSLTYPARIAEKMNLGHINLGFSGLALAEKEIAQCMAEINAACYVICIGENLFGRGEYEVMEERFGPFIHILRRAHPAIPIVCLTPIHSLTERHGLAPGGYMLEDYRIVVRKEVADRRSAGDQNLWIVEGLDILGLESTEGLADQMHPNDLGFNSFVQRLEPILSSILFTNSQD